MILIRKRNSKGHSPRLGRRLRHHLSRSVVVVIAGWGLSAWMLNVPSARASAGQGRASYIPPSGFVPDGATAIRVAEAVLTPVYGADQVANERPFTASLRKDTWTVRGYLPPGYVGGVAVVQIGRKSGCIVRMTHGR